MRDETSIQPRKHKSAPTPTSFLIYGAGIRNSSKCPKTKEKTSSDLRLTAPLRAILSPRILPAEAELPRSRAQFSVAAPPRKKTRFAVATFPPKREASKSLIATLRRLEFPVSYRKQRNVTNSNRNKNLFPFPRLSLILAPEFPSRRVAPLVKPAKLFASSCKTMLYTHSPPC